MVKQRRADIAASLLLIALAVLALAETRKFTGSAALVPRVTLGGILVLSLIQLAGAARSGEEKTIAFDLSRILKIVLLSAAYTACIGILGYYLSTGLYLFGVMRLFGVQSKKILIGVPLGFLAFVALIFARLLSITPPTPFFL